MILSGGCHCGEVRFEVEANGPLEVEDCNCSICINSGYLHFIRPKSAFKLTKGATSLTTYTYNTGIAQHTFCKYCGIKALYVARSNPDGIDININCLDDPPKDLSVVKFDGRNWEKIRIDSQERVGKVMIDCLLH